MMILLMIMMWCWWDRPPPAASPWWRPHVELGLHSSSSCQEGRSGIWYYHHHSHDDRHHNHHPRFRGHECAMRGALSIILAMVERIISIWILDALVPEFIIVITLIAITRRRNQTYLPDLRASLVKRAAWSSGLPELMIISPSITVNSGHPPQHIPHQHHCHCLHCHKLQQRSTCLSRVQERWETRWSDQCQPGKWKQQ